MPACPNCGTDNPDRARFCLECGRRLAEETTAGHESRRTVTVLFSDIVGSTALGESLDPEALRIVLSRYFELMSAILEHHGGTVEKFIGDAIMAVFGLRTIHEDDALRAVRAGLEMREALVGLNVELGRERGVAIATRTGIHTGQVVAGDPAARQTLVTGDAVNTAARLEQAAAAGEILVGETTWRLVRHAATAEAVPPIGAKGKAAPVHAVRLIAIRADHERTQVSEPGPLIGRDAELETLRATFERVIVERRPGFAIVLGPAGVGKSRLVAEFLADAADRARVLQGRCLPYGEGITYWPLRDILQSAAGIVDDDPPAEAMRKLVGLLAGIEDGPLIAARLASAVGLSAEAARREEIFWAVRRTLEHLASETPLVVVIEDIHWAEPTFLDLLGQIADLGRDVPLLVLCSTRLESVDLERHWGGGRPEATMIVLDGLATDAAAALFDVLPGSGSIPSPLRERILASAEGNPLFVREMVGMLVEDGTMPAGGVTAVDPDAVQIPPTIQALMAARVDGLPSPERLLAQRASVVGREFDEVEVAELTPPAARPEVAAALLALVRRELLTSEPSALSVVEAYRFRHILLRDAAYDALRKTDRADLHERFADWLERSVGERMMEYEEIIGHHLAQAHRYRVELREGGQRTDEIGQRAAGHLHAAARRARDRGDSTAAVRLYRIAETLPSVDQMSRARLLLDHGLALSDLGPGAGGRDRADEALALAGATGDASTAARARLLRLDLSQADGSLSTGDPRVLAELEQARVDAEASGDPRALAEAWSSIGGNSWNETRPGDSSEELRIARDYAIAAGEARFALEIELNLLIGTFAGPSPVPEVIELATALIDRSASYPTVLAEAHEILAVSEAMIGRFDDAFVHIARSIATLGDLAQFSSRGNARTFLAWIHRLAGDLPAAEAVLRETLADAIEIGDRFLESFVSCRLAEVLVNQGRYAEAGDPLAVAERQPVGATKSRIVGARARIRAAQGDRGAIEDIDALLAMVADQPWINVRAEAYVDAANATALLGDRPTAEALARVALDLCHVKGNTAFASRIDELLERIAG